MSSSQSFNNHMIIITLVLIFLSTIIPRVTPALEPGIGYVQCIDEYPLFAGAGAISIWTNESTAGEPGTIAIRITGPTNTWFAVGFGQHIMNNTYAITTAEDVTNDSNVGALVDEVLLDYHRLRFPLSPSFISVVTEDIDLERSILIEQTLEVDVQQNPDVFDFRDWLNCTFVTRPLPIIEAEGDIDEIFDGITPHIRRWNFRTITSCNCPTTTYDPSKDPTVVPTLEPTSEPTTASPTRVLCNGAKYQDKMFGFRNDSLWPQQEFISNSCHCKFILHKNGSLTLYGRLDEFDDFIAGWSTATKIHNYSGVSVPQFSINNEVDGTITINEYYYAPDTPPIPIWSVDVDPNRRRFRRLLDENINNFTFHISDECCLSIRNNDDILWSVCANFSNPDKPSDKPSDESSESEETHDPLLTTLAVICGLLLLCLCLAICFGCFVHTKYKKQCNETNRIRVKCVETPTVDVNDGYPKTKGYEKEDLNRIDTYAFDEETKKQIAKWNKEVEIENAGPHINHVYPKITQVEFMQQCSERSTHL